MTKETKTKPVYLEDKVQDLTDEVEQLQWEISALSNKIDELTYLILDLLHEAKK